jgi:rhodanese-related sulfurtransferase
MIPGARRAPLDDLRAELPALGAGPFVVCCQVGQRGHTATSLLQDMGISARNMDGGYLSWKAQQAADAGDPRLLRTDADVHVPDDD